MFKSGLGLRKPPRSHPSSPPPPPNPVGRSKSKKTKIARRSTLRNGGKGFDNSRLELDTATAQKAPPATSSSPSHVPGHLCVGHGPAKQPGRQRELPGREAPAARAQASVPRMRGRKGPEGGRRGRRDPRGGC